MIRLTTVTRVVCTLAAHGFIWSRPARLTPLPQGMWPGVGVLVVGALLALGSPAHGAILQGYSVQKVGGPADNFYNLSGQTAINDAGDIAFRAEGLLGPNPHSSQAGIFVRTGGAFTTIALRIEAGGQFSSIDFPGGISSAGFVAFRGTLPSPSREGIFAGDGGAPITIATAGCGVACEFDNIDLDPAISAAGVVAFVAQDSGVHSIYTQSLFGGPRTLIAFGDGTNPGSPLRAFIEGMSINAAGDVVFRAGLDTSINDVGIFVGNGSTITTIAQTGDLAPNGETFASNFSRPAINAVGDVAFCATLSNGEAGIFLYRNGGLQVLADSIGTFDSFTFGNTGFGCADRSIPSLNAVGDVAFFADGSMPGSGDEAIFLWDGTLHRVVGSGDMVGGAEITNIRYFGGGLNSAGDIAFAADLTGGDPLFVVLAPRTPAAVPEPASLLLLGSGLAALVWSRRYRRR